MESTFPPHRQDKPVQDEVEAHHATASRGSNQSAACGHGGVITKSRAEKLQFYNDLIRELYTRPERSRANIVRFVACECARLGVRAPSRSYVYNILKKSFGHKPFFDDISVASPIRDHAYTQTDERNVIYLREGSCQLCVYQDQFCIVVGFDRATGELIVKPYNATVRRVDADCVKIVDPEDFIRLPQK